MSYIIGKKNQWEYVIGLEVHAQINSNSKLFSSSSTEFDKNPNIHVSLIDAAIPGTLPVLNKHCVHQAIKTGIALNGRINRKSHFDRKNYFYPDLPHGYQISQFYIPIVENGFLDIKTNNKKNRIRITRLHIEQDAGKSIHDKSDSYTYIDLNRAGIGLMEIVTAPDITSPEEASNFLRELRMILKYIGSCDGDMENGSIRCDVNVSMKIKGSNLLGTRCELKNINSLKNIMRAIEYEAKRQVQLLENGESIIQETRLFDPDNGITRTMRLKELANDYRYFPDPDLLPIIVTDEMISKISSEIPELPNDKVQRYIKDFGVKNEDAEILVSDKKIAEYYEKAANLCNPKILANWIISELFGKLNKYAISLESCKITPETLASLINILEKKNISGKIAKIIFDDMFEHGKEPKDIIEEKQLIKLCDIKILTKIVDDILIEHNTSVLEYKNGKEKLFGFFVGIVMKKTDGKADPLIVNKLLKNKLQ